MYNCARYQWVIYSCVDTRTNLTASTADNPVAMDTTKDYIYTYIYIHIYICIYNCARYQWKNIVVWIPEPTALIQPLTAPWQLTRLKIACVPYQWGDREDLQPPEWVMSHIWISHVTHTNEPCLTYEWVVSHLWRSHTHETETKLRAFFISQEIAKIFSLLNGSCHTCECVMSHIWMNHVIHMESHATHMKESSTYEGVKIAHW